MSGNLKEIARLSGVAASSVSRALAGKPGVSQEKREEILEIASRIGYRPNPEARALRTGRASDLLIVIQDQPNDITSYRNHALITLGGHAFDRVRVRTCSASDPLGAVLTRAADEGVAAVIVSGVQEEITRKVANQLEEAATAVVCLDCMKSRSSQTKRIDRVDIDRETGAYEAALLLLAGAGRDTLFFAKNTTSEADSRLAGIKRAYDDASVALRQQMLVPVEGDDFAEGYEVARTRLRRKPPRGLFCYNDKLAVGALKAISEKGLTVPNDIMVVGFDDLSFAAYLTVPLTTVAQPVVACAEAAIDLALLRREEPHRPADRRVFETRLVVRETARAGEEGMSTQRPNARSSTGRIAVMRQ